MTGVMRVGGGGECYSGGEGSCDDEGAYERVSDWGRRTKRDDHTPNKVAFTISTISHPC